MTKRRKLAVLGLVLFFPVVLAALLLGGVIFGLWCGLCLPFLITVILLEGIGYDEEAEWLEKWVERLGPPLP